MSANGGFPQLVGCPCHVWHAVFIWCRSFGQIRLIATGHAELGAERCSTGQTAAPACPAISFANSVKDSNSRPFAALNEATHDGRRLLSAVCGPVQDDPCRVDVRHDSCSASVAVGEGVVPDQLVMDACLGFRRLAGFHLMPVSGICEAGTHPGRDAPDSHADVPPGHATCTGPVPNLAEQMPLEVEGSIFG